MMKFNHLAHCLCANSLLVVAVCYSELNYFCFVHTDLNVVKSCVKSMNGLNS